MKRVLSVILMVAVLVTMAAATSASASKVMYGDVDGNGRINNRDLGQLQRHLNGWDVNVDEIASDVDDNGRVNNRDLGRLQQYLNEWDVTLGPEEPEEPSVELPEVGYDIDGRGRILIKEISQEDNIVTVTLENKSSKWITEETSYVLYTCTDADGNVLSLETKYYGTLYFGMLETHEVDTYTILLPEGTAKLEFGDWYIVYWSQWS